MLNDITVPGKWMYTKDDVRKMIVMAVFGTSDWDVSVLSRRRQRLDWRSLRKRVILLRRREARICSTSMHLEDF